MPQKRSRAWSVADARAVFVEQAASGLSLSNFARREGIDAGRLYRWKRQLDAEPERPRAAASPPPAVIELRSGPRPAERIEIVLASGVTVRVTEAIEPSVLARVISALR